MLFDRTGNHVTDDNVSTEATGLIMEAFVKEAFTPDELSMFQENQTEIDDAVSNGILMERSIVRLDKNAKISKAKKMAIFTIAKEKNDPKFKKLLTVWKMERFLESELEKKYGNEASRRAKKVVADSAKKSKGTLIKKVAERAKDTFSSDK